MEEYAEIQELIEGKDEFEQQFEELNNSLIFFEKYIKTAEPIVKLIKKFEVSN